jgi:hypothetical protein
MKIKRERKERGLKLNGKRSIDFCDYCFRPGCDSMGGSPKYRKKIDKRLEQGLCPSCGQMPCKCKSRDMSEKQTLDREIWIAQRKCKTCVKQDCCTVKDVRKCKEKVALVENDAK